MNLLKTNHFVRIIFFVIIISVPVFWLLTGGNYGKTSQIEDRELSAFPRLSYSSFKIAVKSAIQGQPGNANKIFFNQFTNRKFQQKVENAASDQFPLRMLGIQAAKAFERAQIALVYSLLPDPAIPTDMKSSLYVIRDGSLLFSKPTQLTQSSFKIIDDRINSYKELIKDHPDIHFYAYYLERITNASYHPLLQYFPGSDQGQRLKYFEENKPAGLILGKMTFTGLEDYKKYNYRTDHHWNIYGALRAYDDIYSMLAKNYPGISPPVNHAEIRKFQDIQFLGSEARQSLYPIRPDDFEVPILDLQSHIVYEDGKITADYCKNYLEGVYSHSKYTNHFGMCFGYESQALVEYVFDNGSDRNLLIIGDSFTKPIHPLLASHYKHTYRIDLRAYDNFSFSDFIKQNPVDDVIFIGDCPVIFTSDTWNFKQ